MLTLLFFGSLAPSLVCIKGLDSPKTFVIIVFLSKPFLSKKSLTVFARSLAKLKLYLSVPDLSVCPSNRILV